ncbi:hypothetical protein ACQY0O_001839 [Thecaphora frezii]
MAAITAGSLVARETAVTPTHVVTGGSDWTSAGSAEQSAMSQAPTPDLARSQSGNADSDDDSACIGSTPSDTFTTNAGHVKDADLRMFADLLGLAKEPAQSSTEGDEASRIHDIDLLFGDGLFPQTSDAETTSPAAASQDAEPSNASGSSTAPSQAQRRPPSGLVLPQGDGRSKSQTPAVMPPAANPTCSGASAPVQGGQPTAVSPALPAPAQNSQKAAPGAALTVPAQGSQTATASSAPPAPSVVIASAPAPPAVARPAPPTASRPAVTPSLPAAVGGHPPTTGGPPPAAANGVPAPAAAPTVAAGPSTTTNPAASTTTGTTAVTGAGPTVSSTSAPAAPPVKRPRGRPPKYPRPDGSAGAKPSGPAAPKKAPAPKRKAASTEDGTPRKKPTKAAPKGKAAATRNSAVPVSIADLGRMIPKNASPEAIQAFIQKHVKLFADLFMALQKQASEDRSERERAKEELKGIARSRSVGASPATSTGIDATVPPAPPAQAPAPRGQSAPPPLLPHGTSTGPGLFSRLSNDISSAIAPPVQTNNTSPENQQAPGTAPSAPTPVASTSADLPSRAPERDFSQVLTQALTDVMAGSSQAPAQRADSLPGPSSQAPAETASTAASTPAAPAAAAQTGAEAAQHRKSEANVDLRNEVKKRMTEIASGHDSLREEMLRLKVDKQFFDNAQKTVDERIQVLRARIAARSEDLYKEREANRKAREEARQVKKDRKAAERMLKEAEKLENRLEAQALLLEAEIASEEQARREREEAERLESEAAAAVAVASIESTPGVDADGDVTMFDGIVPIPEALDGERASECVSMNDAELARMLGISLNDLSRFTEAVPSAVPETTAATAVATPSVTAIVAPQAEPTSSIRQIEPMDLSHLLQSATGSTEGEASGSVAADVSSLAATINLAGPAFDLGAFLEMGMNATATPLPVSTPTAAAATVPTPAPAPTPEAATGKPAEPTVQVSPETQTLPTPQA